MPINYVSHRGKHQVAIVLCPDICMRFVHLSKDKDGGWVVRDYIKDLKSAGQDSNIEQRVVFSFEKKRLLPKETHFLETADIEEKANWKALLETLSSDMLNQYDLMTPPKDLEGRSWEPL